MILSLLLQSLVVVASSNLTEVTGNFTGNYSTTLTQPKYNSNNFQYEGVAIGGWLVLEPYITPSLFNAFKSGDVPLDEYHYTKQLGQEEAGSRLKQHWDTFYNELDFEEIKSYGLNMVRIPIGYWAFQTMDGDPYVLGAQDYLDKAIVWAKNQDLKVWIDLHGVPGSQNGFDNSGYRDIGFPGWFNSTDNVQVTYEVLNTIYSKYGTGDYATNYGDTILGIEVVNEPFSPVLNQTLIEMFYNTAYENARWLQTVNNTIVFHDAFQPIGYYDNFMNERKQPGRNNSIENYNIMIDHHHYEVFSLAVALNITTHISNIVNYSQSIKNELLSHPAVVGEWSAALTDCAPWVNGIGLGSRYEGKAPYSSSYKKTGSCKNIDNINKWSANQKKNTRKFIEIQLDQYSRNTNGWIFWCFKTESTIEWDFKRLVLYGLMPQPLNNFTYIKNGTDSDPSPSGAAAIGLSYSLVGAVFAFVLLFQA